MKIYCECSVRLEWVIVKALKNKTNIRNNQLKSVLEFFRFGDVLSPYYLKKLEGR